MKKFIGLVIAVMLCMALAAPAFAEEDPSILEVIDSSNVDIMEDKSYDEVIVEGSSNLWIYANLNINDSGTLILRGGNILIYGSLTGSSVTMDYDSSCYIHLVSGGKIDITFANSQMANIFSIVLTNSKIEYTRIDNRIVSPCPHENAETEYICFDCGAALTAPTASTLSGGNVNIIVGVASVAVGFLAAMFIFRKKKPASSADD